MLARIVSENRKLSSTTSPSAARSESLVTSAHVVPVDADRAGLRVVEARQQLRDGGLARAGCAHHGHRLARLDPQRQAAQHRLGRHVAERVTSSKLIPAASGGSAAASGLSVMAGRESMMSKTRITLARASCPSVTI